MNFTINSEPEDVLNYARPILVPIFEAIEVSAPKAQRIITENGWAKSPWLFSHLVRADVKAILDGKLCPVDFDNEFRIVKMGNVSMEGLSTKFDGIDIKILKGFSMPPAVSDSRRFFYQQGASLLWPEDAPPPINSLLILWHYSENSNLQLDLVCPKNAEQWSWQVPVPHPGAWPIQIVRPSEVDDNLDDLLKPDSDSDENNKKKPN
jgi:hypothetical protein